MKNSFSFFRASIKGTIFLCLLFFFGSKHIIAETIDLFERPFDIQEKKVVVVAYRSDSESGIDSWTTNFIQDGLIKKGIRCFSERELLTVWKDEVNRNVLVNNIKRVAEIGGNPFKDTWIMKFHIDQDKVNTAGAIGRYSVATAHATLEIVDGNTGELIKTRSSLPMGTPTNPGWIAETQEGAIRAAIQSALFETTSSIGTNWWEPPGIGKINLKIKETREIRVSEKPTSLAFICKHLVYSSKKGCFASDIDTRNQISIGNGPASSVAFDQTNTRIAVSRPASVEIWSMENGEFKLLKQFVCPGALSKMKFSASGKYLAGSSEGGEVFLWDITAGTVLVKEKVEFPVHAVAAKDAGVICIVHDTSFTEIGGDRKKNSRGLALFSNEKWSRCSSTIGTLSDEGFFSVLGLKILNIDLQSGAKAQHILNIIDAHGGTKQIFLPDDPGRTRTPTQVIFPNNSFRFLIAGIKYEANRAGYIGIWDLSTAQNILTMEYQKPNYPEIIAISPDGQWLGVSVISRSNVIELYHIN